MTALEKELTDKRDEIVRAASNGQYQDADDILLSYLRHKNYEVIDRLNEAITVLRRIEPVVDLMEMLSCGNAENGSIAAQLRAILRKGKM